MSVLKPYIESGKLVVRSKQMGMDKVGTLSWDGAVAQALVDNLLSAFYGKDKGARGAVGHPHRKAGLRHPRGHGRAGGASAAGGVGLVLLAAVAFDIVNRNK